MGLHEGHDVRVVVRPAAADTGALVYRRGPAGWAFEAELTTAFEQSIDWFGRKVAGDGDTVVVSAFNRSVGTVHGAGAGHVYVHDGTAW